MDDYYAGPEGARRLLGELDVLLQHMVDSLDPAESMTCDIALRLENGETVQLNKIYRHDAQRRRATG